MTAAAGAEATGFGVDHLPYGSFARYGRRLCTRLGDRVVDLAGLARDGLLPTECDAPDLNRLMAAGPHRWAAIRAAIQEVLTDAGRRSAVHHRTHPLSSVDLALPFQVKDYVDFYSSEQHALNAGRIFRPEGEPLPANWRHMPIGYHGRAGTVVVSGTPIRRPHGLVMGPDGVGFGPTEKLDFELEMGYVVGSPSPPGERVAVSDAERYIFGVALLNDWSARDIQAWEYQPLGPFLGKSFATSVAAWVTPLTALSRVRATASDQDPPPQPHLRRHRSDAVFDIDLSVTVETATGREAVVTRTSGTNLYWSVAQQIAHITSNGAPLRTGDLLATGTISGPEPGSWGSLLEITSGGRDPVDVDGESRTYLEDGDRVTLGGRAGQLELGTVTGIIEAAE